MLLSLSRGLAVPVVGLLLLVPPRATAQDGHGIDDEIDKIVKEPPPADKTDPPKPEVQTLPDGVKYEKRKDGVEVFTRPDGTKTYVHPDGKKVTIAANGERVYEVPNEKPQFLPPRVEDKDDYKPHKRPPENPKPDPGIYAPSTPLPDFKMPEPPADGRKHATWQDLELDPRLPSTLVNPGPESKPKYTPPAPGSDDKLAYESRTPGKSNVFTYESGAVQTVLPDGRSITTWPGIPQAAVRDADGKLTYLAPGADGAIRIPGAGGGPAVTVDPMDGKTYVEYPSGPREVVSPDGRVGMSTGTGGSEIRGPDGRLLQSTITDPDTGTTVRQYPTGPAIIMKDGKPVAIGARTADGYEYTDANGKKVVISELFDPKKFTGTVAGRQAAAVAYNQPPRTGKYTPPTGPTIFDFARARITQMPKDGTLKPADRETLEQMRALEKAGDELKAKGTAGDDLDRAMKLADATLKKSALESELKQAQAQATGAKASLAAEQKRAGDAKAALLLRETRAETLQTRARDEEFRLSIEANGISQLMTVWKAREARAKAQEKIAKDDVEAALKRIDFSKYNRCENKKPYKECDHEAIKKKWLNEQLAGLLGANGVERLKKVVAEREAVDKEKADLDAKEKAVEDKRSAAKAMAKEGADLAAEMKKERARLDAGGSALQKQVEQAQARVDRTTKAITEMDAAIQKYTKGAQ